MIHPDATDSDLINLLKAITSELKETLKDVSKGNIGVESLKSLHDIMELAAEFVEDNKANKKLEPQCISVSRLLFDLRKTMAQ